jgi:hypothetical protein
MIATTGAAARTIYQDDAVLLGSTAKRRDFR